MLTPQSSLRTAGGWLVGLTLLAGCQSVPPPVAAPLASTYIPPLSGAPVSCAPLSRNNGVASTPALEPPPLPGSEPVSPQPRFSPPSLAPPSTASAPHGSSASCLPGEREWKQMLEQQAAAVQSRMNVMEAELAAARNEIRTVNNELRTSQTRIGELNQNLTHWQGETRRLETEMRNQQQSDLKSLDDLTAAVNLLLDQQRTAQAPSAEQIQ